MVSEPGHRYNYTFTQGLAKCESLGMQIVTLNQIREAFDQGYSICLCGWLSDGKARFPLHTNTPCDRKFRAIHGCYSQNKSNVFCYKM